MNGGYIDYLISEDMDIVEYNSNMMGKLSPILIVIPVTRPGYQTCIISYIVRINSNFNIYIAMSPGPILAPSFRRSLTTIYEVSTNTETTHKYYFSDYHPVMQIILFKYTRLMIPLLSPTMDMSQVRVCIIRRM